VAVVVVMVQIQHQAHQVVLEHQVVVAVVAQAGYRPQAQ
jgi:hypothetical protein